jgi:hypothetical protein
MEVETMLTQEQNNILFYFIYLFIYLLKFKKHNI